MRRGTSKGMGGYQIILLPKKDSATAPTAPATSQDEDHPSGMIYTGLIGNFHRRELRDLFKRILRWGSQNPQST